MRLPKINIISVDDWKVLYLDNHMVFQGHSIPMWEWIDLIRGLGAAEVEVLDVENPDGDYIGFPDKFSDFKR